MDNLQELPLNKAAESQLNSPPKPRRTVKMTAVGAALYTPPPMITNSQIPPQEGVQIDILKVLENATQENGSSLDLQGQLVDEAVENIGLTLPQAVQEVVSKQQHQIDELSKQKNILHQVQVEATLGSGTKEQLTKSEKDVARIQRKIFLEEEENFQKEKQITMMTSEIETLITRNEKTRHRVDDKKREMNDMENMLGEYRKKMEDHRDKVEEWQREKTDYQEMKRQEEILNQLKADKAALESDPEAARRLLNGESLQQQKQDLDRLKQQDEELKQLIQTKNKEMKLQKEKHKNTKQEIDILHKRNAAQIMRLQRQLKEKQSRNSLWNKQTTDIERSITALRSQLERDTDSKNDNQQEQGVYTANTGAGSGTLQGNIANTGAGLGTSQGNIANTGAGLGTSQGNIANTGAGLGTSQGNIANTGAGSGTLHGETKNSGTKFVGKYTHHTNSKSTTTK